MLDTTHPRILVFIDFVKQLAALSKCTDKKVATIIVSADGMQVDSIGINGGPKGGLDCLCTLGGKYTCAHAEANALIKCKAETAGKIMICTLSPCITCATLIVNSNIAAFYYLEDYKNNQGLQILKDADIIVKKIERKI